MAKRTYEADGIRVHWDSSLCIHTANCLNALPAVFDSQRRPWIDVNAAETDQIARTVEMCPTGALRYERLDGEPGEQAPSTTTIVPWPNGPLHVRGRVEVRDAEGNLFEGATRVTLCRCGNSQNQPYCDLSHRSSGFRNTPRAQDPKRDQAESPTDISSESGP